MKSLSLFTVLMFAMAVFYACKPDEPQNKDPLTYDEGVVINGVKWATRNVDMPNTFAQTPESAGMLYQWDSKVGWSNADPMVNSDSETEWELWNGNDNDSVWQSANNPSPVGWRVPTLIRNTNIT